MPNKERTIISLVHKIRLHVRRGKGTAESFSRENYGKHRRTKVGEKSCVTFLLCDPGWYVHKPDVQNKWEENIVRTETSYYMNALRVVDISDALINRHNDGTVSSCTLLHLKPKYKTTEKAIS